MAKRTDEKGARGGTSARSGQPKRVDSAGKQAEPPSSH
jgi:hypothetical protein